MDWNSDALAAAKQLFVLAVTGVTCYCVMRPVTLRSVAWVAVHHSAKQTDEASAPPPPTLTYWKLNFASAAVLAIFLFRLFDIVSWHAILEALLHSGSVQPWAVLVIFFTLAYSSISLDVTGFSKYIALRVLQSTLQSESEEDDDKQTTDRREHEAANRHRRFLIVVYVLSGVISVIASNDVLVLTLTPVLLHYTAMQQRKQQQLMRSQPVVVHGDSPPQPSEPSPGLEVLLIEYFSANTFSAFLLVGNPTNIIIGQAADIHFASYFAALFVPTMAVVVTSMACLWWGRHAVHAASASSSSTSAVALRLGDVTPSSALRGPQEDATITHHDLLDVEVSRHGQCADELPTTTTGSASNQADGAPTMPSSSMMIIQGLPHNEANAEPSSHAQDAEDEDENDSPSRALKDRNGAIFRSIVLGSGVVALTMLQPMWVVTTTVCVLMLCSDLVASGIDHPSQRRVWEVLARLPWSVAPFAFCMFILVGVLDQVGMTRALGSVYVAMAEVGGPLLGASCGGLVLTILLMSVFNNQPATIFAVRALLEPTTVQRLTSQSLFCCIAVTALGSNIAACYTIKGALAGVMWESILKNHGQSVAWWTFVKEGCRRLLLPTVVGAVAVWGVSLVAPLSLLLPPPLV